MAGVPHPDRIWCGNHGSGLDFSALAEAWWIPHAAHLCSLPRHNTLDLGLQREAQNRPDQDDQPENQDIVEGGCDSDRTDEVGRHEDFQPEQQCPADSRAQRQIALGWLA